MDQATGMTYNVMSPSSAGTTPTTIAPSSTHTSPTVVATPSPVAPTMIEVIQTVQTSGAFACIVQECSNKVPTEHTICEACHGRATMMFQEMRKFSRPCAQCQTPVFALATQIQPADVFCQPCMTKKMPPPSGIPLSSPRTPRPIAPAPTAQNMQVQPDRHRRTPNAHYIPYQRPPADPAHLPHKRKASGGPPVNRPMYIPPVIRIPAMPPRPHIVAIPMPTPPGPTLVINPNTRAVRVVQPSAHPQGQPGVVQLREPQPFPWPPHNTFRDLVGLPHLNVHGAYIHPQVTLLHQAYRPPVQQQPPQPQQPTRQQPTYPAGQLQPPPSSPVKADSSQPQEPTSPIETSSSRATPSRLASGLHRCEAPGCVTLIPNSNPAPYCKRCSTLDVYSPSTTPIPLTLSLPGDGESSTRKGSFVTSLLDLDPVIDPLLPAFPSSPLGGRMVPGSSLFKVDSLFEDPPSSPTSIPSGLNWDSDVSELTPLEDSSSEDESSSDEDEAPRPRLVLRLPPRKSLPPATPTPTDPKAPLDLTAVTLPDKWKLDFSKNFICRVFNCCNLIRPMSRSPFRLCIRHKNSIKTYCKRHPPKPDGTPRDVQYRPPRHCRTKDCEKVLLPKQEYPWRVCEDCRIRKQQAKATRYGPLWEFLSTPRTSDFLRNPHVQQPSEVFPCYQDFVGLMGSFEFSLMGFLVGQIQYLHHKLDGDVTPTPSKENTPVPNGHLEGGADETRGVLKDVGNGNVRRRPTVFDFDGEFSVVADPAGGDVSKRIEDVRKAIEKVLGCELSPGGLFVAPEGRIIGRFYCTHETTKRKTSPSETPTFPLKEIPPSPDVPLASLPKATPHEPMDVDPPSIPLPPPSPTKQEEQQDPTPTSPASSDTVVNSAENPVVVADAQSETSNETLSSPQKEKAPVISPSEVIKRMSGELQVIISWDRRHRYFPGLRTVVRFKLVG